MAWRIGYSVIQSRIFNAPFIYCRPTLQYIGKINAVAEWPISTTKNFCGCPVPAGPEVALSVSNNNASLYVNYINGLITPTSTTRIIGFVEFLMGREGECRVHLSPQY